MKYLNALLLFCLIFIAACSGKKPLSIIEATNQEAIYNVLFQDNFRLVSFDFFDTVVPDTQTYLNNPDPDKPCLWHEVQYFDDDLIITILDQPVQSPVGLVYESHITYTVTDTGRFRMLRYNAAADSFERYSTKFNIRVARSATCQQWGRSNQLRRGWLLTSISDARVTTPGQNYHFLNDFGYSSLTHNDTTCVYDTYDPVVLVSFLQNEQVTVHYQIQDSLDKVFIYIPKNDYGYQLADPQQDSLGNWQTIITMPSRKIYGQLFFLVVNVGRFDQVYKASGYSYNYRIR